MSLVSRTRRPCRPLPCLPRRSLLFLFFPVFLVSVSLSEQEPPNPSQAQHPAEIAPQPRPDASRPAANSPSPVLATEFDPVDARERLAPPHNAQTFKFTKVDLELLRQVDAFDQYMEEKGWVYDDPETAAYLEKLGHSLVPEQTPENVKWRFRAVRDLEVNAFALPNGSIYVNSGLLSRMENEAQLAGVLAHEVTHVTNRHSYLEYRRA